MSAPYPQPPWHTQGRAIAQPFLVDATRLELPAGFEPMAVAGRAIGILAVIDYLAPSPLEYAELVWMPCMVRARGKRGYFVAKMYVDSAASLAGGRELWALPKQMARFSLDGREVTVDTEDGAHLVLEVSRRGPAVSAPVSSGTLQDGDDEVVRFRGSGRARVRSGGLRVKEVHGLESWTGWAGARRLPGLGASLDAFEITMHAPLRIPRT